VWGQPQLYVSDVAVEAEEGDGVEGGVWLEPLLHVLPQQGSGDVPVEVVVVGAALHLYHHLQPHVCVDDEAYCPSQQRSCHSLDRREGGHLNASADVRQDVPCT